MTNLKIFGITYTTPEVKQRAEQISREFKLLLIEPPELVLNNHLVEAILVVSTHYVGLYQHQQKPFYLDFCQGKSYYRFQQRNAHKELLAHTLGKEKDISILDATAGLGRDCFILATLGYELTALERSPLIYLLLKDALERASKHPTLSNVIKNIRLIHADSKTWLSPNSAQKPDVIYLDPMFPIRKKNALVKKEMMLMQHLLNDEDDGSLLIWALACAKKRVVVKRPRLSHYLGGKMPHFSKIGKSIRFDIYLI